MKVLHLNTYALEGGAARAAYRLNQGLRQIGVSSQMLVGDKRIASPAVVSTDPLLPKLGYVTRKLPLQLYPKRKSNSFSAQWFPDAIVRRVNQLNPDIVHLHWIAHGFLQIETLAKLKKPLVWTLHDMLPFTGGCHYAQDCDRYTKQCGSCPQLGSNSNWDLSRWIWHRKAQAWKDLDLTIVTPSRWLAKCVESSSLLRQYRVEVIPNVIDTQIYKPIDRSLARKILNLPQDKQLILFGAEGTSGDPRKGFQFLLDALAKLRNSGWSDRLELAIFGESSPKNSLTTGFKAHYLGRLSDDMSLAIVYSAADVYVAPSTQDNLPNTVMESLACGTPCVAFRIGGMPDMIEHCKNGYLAQPFDTHDLASGLEWVLAEQHQSELSICAREKVNKEFSAALQAHRFASFYQKILSEA